MKREKLFAIMNIAGLAIGIGCGLVIYKIITYELSLIVIIRMRSRFIVLSTGSNIRSMEWVTK